MNMMADVPPRLRWKRFHSSIFESNIGAINNAEFTSADAAKVAETTGAPSDARRLHQAGHRRRVTGWMAVATAGRDAAVKLGSMRRTGSVPSMRTPAKSVASPSATTGRQPQGGRDGGLVKLWDARPAGASLYVGIQILNSPKLVHHPHSASRSALASNAKNLISSMGDRSWLRTKLRYTYCRAPAGSGTPAWSALLIGAPSTVSAIQALHAGAVINEVNFTSTVQSVDMATGQRMLMLPVQPKAVSRMSPYGQLATALRQPDARTACTKAASSFRARHPLRRSSTGMAFSPDGKLLATTGHGMAAENLGHRRRKGDEVVRYGPSISVSGIGTFSPMACTSPFRLGASRCGIPTTGERRIPPCRLNPSPFTRISAPFVPVSGWLPSRSICAHVDSEAWARTATRTTPFFPFVCQALGWDRSRLLCGHRRGKRRRRLAVSFRSSSASSMCSSVGRREDKPIVGLPERGARNNYDARRGYVRVDSANSLNTESSTAIMLIVLLGRISFAGAGERPW